MPGRANWHVCSEGRAETHHPSLWRERGCGLRLIDQRRAPMAYRASPVVDIKSPFALWDACSATAETGPRVVTLALDLELKDEASCTKYEVHGL